MTRSAPLLLLALPAVAHAGWSEDLSISGMTLQDGLQQVDPQPLGEAWSQVVRELGSAVGSRSLPSAHGLGARDFEITLESPVSITLTDGDAASPQAWDRLAADDDASPVQFQPGLTLRKGLPFGLEVGMTGRWFGLQHAGVISGFARAAIVDTLRPAPDINVHAGYSAYIGNREIDLSTFDVGMTIGTTVAAGAYKNAASATFSPYADVSLLVVNAMPKVNADVREATNTIAYGRRDTDDDPSNNVSAVAIPQFAGGFQLNSGVFVMRLTGGYALKSNSFVNLAVGVSY